MNRLYGRSYGRENGPAPVQFLWFNIDLERMVIINVESIARVTFCFDYIQQIEQGSAYYDNFNILHKDTFLEERKTKEGEVRLHVIEDHSLPQAIVYHKGKAPDDLYEDNPITYSDLEDLCLEGLNFELEGEEPLRQFINFSDDDGEENFIPLNQVMIMEFDASLMYGEEDDYEDLEEDEIKNMQDDWAKFEEFKKKERENKFPSVDENKKEPE